MALKPLILSGGSFSLQLSPDDTRDPNRLYIRLSDWRQTLDQFWRQVATCINSNQATSGTTTSRPTSGDLATLPNSGIGFMYFDTTLGKPVWWKGVAWVDATGAAV